jgi:chromosome transmission fidelity protein 1
MEETYDIEDIVKVGRDVKICPYYGSRHTIPIAELIALPYNILFQKETRDSFSINLKNQVIIIDEAHNLIDTITQINSVEITSMHVTQALNQMNSYLERYKARLSAKNLLYCKQLINVLSSLNKCFNPKEEEKNVSVQNGKLGISKFLVF